MTKKEAHTNQTADFCRQAEKIAREEAAQLPENLLPENRLAMARGNYGDTLPPRVTVMPQDLPDHDAMLHELRVHQIELEMKNRELRQRQEELDAARARYLDLYDLAPVGYITVSEQGLILDANLTAATMLGVARGVPGLAQPIFSQFIHWEDQDIYYRFRKQLLETGAPQTCELRMTKKDGPTFLARLQATVVQYPATGTLLYRSDKARESVLRIVMSDITDRKQNAITEAQLRIQMFAPAHALTELLQETLTEAELLTDSHAGFYHFVEPDQGALSLQAWSAKTLQHMCQVTNHASHYPVNEAGVWADCIRERRPVVYNDYATLPNLQGLPAGHTPIIRELVVPVLRAGAVVAILGVGNKPKNYDEWDIATVASLADLTWGIVEQKREKETNRRLAAELAVIAEIGRVVSATLNLDQVFERVAAEILKLIPFDMFLVNLKKKPDGDQFIVAYVSGMDNPVRRVGTVYHGHGTTSGVVMNTRVGILVQPENTEEIRDLYPDLYETFKTGIRSALSVPLLSLDEVIGSMNFRSKKLNAYTEQDLHLAERIGMQIAGAIRSADLFDNLSRSEGKLKKSQEVLARLNAQIQAKNQELEQVVYVASHELRSPLVNIDGYGREVEYALAELEKALAADHASPEALRAAALPQVLEMSNALRYIRGSAKQMDAVLTGLLKLSRSGRAALTIAPLNMNELIAGVVAASDFQIRQAGVELRVAELPPCRGDAVQVNQVFANLLGNALKYLDPHRPGVIGISGVIEKERAVYIVEDTGIGIAPAHQNKIFELFHRLEPSQREGEGLGLAIVRQVLGRLEGKIWVESQTGAGSRFSVALPADK